MQRWAGEWQLERPLGSGGMAEVFAAKTGAGASAAVKLLRTELATEREVVARFWREAGLASQIGHPGIVSVLGQGYTEEGGPYIAMELLEGQTLEERRRAPGGVPPAELFALIDQLLDVLDAAHGHGIIHRDLKPANLFLTQSGQLKVLDFGIARVLEAGADDLRTATGVAIGTVTYMAPEQAAGLRDQIDARTDLFAVGAILFRMLSGRRVHEATGSAQLLLLMASTPAPSLLSVAPHVPQPVAAVVDRALAFHKNQRFSSARELQAALRAATATVPAAPTLLSATRPAEDPATAVPTRPLHAPEEPAVEVPVPRPAEASPRKLGALPFVLVGSALLLIAAVTAGSFALFMSLPETAPGAARASPGPSTAAPAPSGSAASGAGLVGIARSAGFEEVPLEAVLQGADDGGQSKFFHRYVVTRGVVRKIKYDAEFYWLMIGEENGPWLSCMGSGVPKAKVGDAVTVRGKIDGLDVGGRRVPLGGCEIVK